MIFKKKSMNAKEAEDEKMKMDEEGGGVEVWGCGGLEVWRCGGVGVWGCGGVEVWRCGGLEVWRG